MVEITNTEELGMTAEKVICDLSGIDSLHIEHRANTELEKEIKPVMRDALEELPDIKESVGQEKGEKGGLTKNRSDFKCENGETIEVKTTKSSWKLCPHKCGQPGDETFDEYFGHLYDGKINYEKAKKLVINKFHEMMPIYLENLFDNDYLLFLYFTGKNRGYEIIEKENLPDFDEWEEDDFSFTQTVESWNESCTIRYDGTSIGEFQLHSNRNCYKFRFQIKKLSRILEMEMDV